MSIINSARLAIYRCHEKGYEIFLVKNEMSSDPNVWKLPIVDIEEFTDKNQLDVIELDNNIVAIEGDWHNIPSIRGIIKHDIKVVKSLVKEALPGIEKGKFVAVKEMVKKVMPEEYKMIKELKEIITEQKSIRNI